MKQPYCPSVVKAAALGALMMIAAACSTPTVVVETPETERIYGLPAFDENLYANADAMLSRNVAGLVFRDRVNPTWLSETLFWYSVNTPDGTAYHLVNTDTRAVNPLFDQERLAAALDVLDEEKTVSAENLVVSQITVSDDARFMEFRHDGSMWNLDLGTYEVQPLKSDSIETPRSAVFSPDGRYAAFIRAYNLWVRDMHTGDDLQLTTDGEHRFGYATDSQGWFRSDRPILKWSREGYMISTYQLDERNVPEMHILRTAQGRPELVSWPYAIPSDPDDEVPMHHRVVIDVETQNMVRIQGGPYHQRTSNCCGLTRGNDWADNQFIDGNRKLAFVATSRDYKEVTLKIADLRTGEVREVFHERDEIFIETNLNSRGVPNWRVLYDQGEFIWFSRESDWGHLYLHDLETGERIHSITEGPWNVSNILRIEDTSGRIWFTALGIDPDKDPYEEYVYSVLQDGTGLSLHTPDTGHHSVSLSPEGGFLVDTFSTVNSAPVTVLRDRFGEVILTLEEADLSRLFEAGWQFPEPFSAMARDGETEIFGLMFKPMNFDPDKSYPIINSIYPGPQIGSVGTRGFAHSRRGQAQALAELGFIVVQIDALGTPFRSRSFHAAYYGDMSDNGLPDQISAMRELAERHSFIDIERAGMYGHSGGGFATAAAMFNHGDFFKAGVAGAGNMDNRGYTFYWGEKFQGPFERFEDGTDSFTNQALQYQVEGLQGHLLISYGTMDTNVHPNTTLQLIDALIDANKDFDLIVLPNRGHGYANESYKLRRTWDFFVRHLHGMEPPREYSFR
ncbi:Dipeptidyl aminopeptidase/acylaminoacyl peptidase [Cyclonatronum proteinivorum]|uniref:Dipeptidyl aminopeptidase/acylaminoacyl peptidase n=1 Tax=Cyclonatronum proteinivorum TaxID=1457365 RepID=A0A345ULI6_9BACT|nr:DPP IV N-terminal domain-containing protein [Cyclonatronum proteinivorum]AXJ01338.1 Dipeptidyl aminopeptidase/acylaminoacyl peptidase [Cyclonatronum proteinivorum]